MKNLECWSRKLFWQHFFNARRRLWLQNRLRKLRLIINVIDSSEKTIDCALNSDFSDFEDAIQYYTAQNHKLTTIVTRNVKDYKNSNLSVETPEMFLCSREFV